MKLYTYYADDNEFYNIIEDIIESSNYSDEILYSNFGVEDGNGKKVFAVNDNDNTIIFDYNFFTSFMKDYTNKVVKNYLGNIHNII